MQYVTGHDKDGKLPADIDWRSLADPRRPPSSICRSGRFAALAAKAIAHGLDPATPAIAVVRATRPDERKIVSTIAGLGPRLDHEAMTGPAIVLIGRVFMELLGTETIIAADTRARPRTQSSRL